ncbi:hypothetical protein BaRGS_00011450 [Batillaria attramentaria]|uniref:Cysteine and histidine-rich domain-containing protein 1 n=1 Tax=Batillaria attramentaria TaxID=370345 RepID=A0ABD0LDK1_9CAEN
MALEYCYNKGCGQKFSLEDNNDSACQYHPGVPVFHDALKGWSCCPKRTTDFTEFLNIKGCTTGPHSNVKPPEPEKPEKDETDKTEVVVVEAPRHRSPMPSRQAERPSPEEPVQRLKVTFGASLRTQLEKLKIEEQSKPEVSSPDGDAQAVTIGTQCKNNACKCSYQGPESSSESCRYHPGVPIFHEGMKYWTCCQRKTSDFDNFLNQEGCEVGKHVWVKSKEQQAAEASCRVDWHQTGPIVCISIFAKTADPEKSYFEANRVKLSVYIVFNKGSSIFQRTFHLREPINLESSEVKMLGTKVEINLRKAEPFSWPSLEVPQDRPSASAQGENDDDD